MEPTAGAASQASQDPPRGRFPLSERTGARGRALAAGLGAAIGLLFLQAQIVSRALTAETFRNDFRLYLGAARVGLAHGFASIYDLTLQREAVEALMPAANFQPFVSPPVDAWLAVPFAGLPFTVGVALWTLMLTACVLGTWLLLAPGQLADRMVQLLLACGFLPLGFAVSVGQLAPVIGLGVAAAFALLKRGRPTLAGAALVAVWLKPQAAVLVAPALLVAGHRRAFISWLLTSAALGLGCAAALGPSGIAAYRVALAGAAQWDLMRRFSLPGQVLWGPYWPLVSLAVAAATMAVAWRVRVRPGLVMAAGLAGSLLFSPYLGLQDLCLVVPAAWLAWQDGVPRWHFALSAVVYVMLDMSLVLGPVPVLLAELTWLGSIWLIHADGRPRRSPTQGTGRRRTPPVPRTAAPTPSRGR
jgi:hypothetical protein